MMPQAQTCRGHAGTATVSVLTLVLAVLLAAAGIAEAEPASGELLKVVLVSRHGVRTPIEDIKSLNLWTQRQGGWPPVWSPPTWKNQDAGDLTEVGSVLATIMGEYYRSDDRLFPADRCPASKTVFIRADVDERTKATAAALAKGLAQACPEFPITVLQNPPKIANKPVDPLFHPASAALVCPLRAKQAVQSIEARLPPGKFPALDKANAATISEMQHVLHCCKRDICPSPPCKLTDLPTSVKIDPKEDKIKMEGAIGKASTAAEIFLLEYANGFGLNDVGWGQVASRR